MKKLISIIAVFVLALSLFGCTTKSNSQDETEYSKGNYNIAYVTIAFFTEIDKNRETNQMSINPDYHGDMYYMETFSSGYTSNSLQMTYYCRINDWEYGKSDTIILYLTDGRALQTSTNNVLLMYDPDFQ